MKKSTVYQLVGIVCCLCIPLHTVFSQVSSITSESITAQTLSDVSESETRTIELFIARYAKKKGVNKLRAIRNKMTNTFIRNTPVEVRGYLTTIQKSIDTYLRNQRTPSTTRLVPNDNTITKAKSSVKNTPKTQPTKSNDTPVVVGKDSGPSVVQKPIVQRTNISDIYQLNAGTIDVSVLQETRLQWVNDLRKERERNTIRLSEPLHTTAAQRSESMKNKGVADHKRFTNSSYYNYGQLVTWFEARGIVFTNVNRATFTENIGYARLTCIQGDCTQVAITAMRTVFDYFISEEGTAYDAHWRTIMHPEFKIMGLGISVDESKKRLYITQHYGTEIQ